MNDFWWDVIAVVGIVTIIFLLSAILLFVPFYYISKNSCYRSFPDREVRYTLISGCLIKVNGEFIRSDNVRFIIKGAK
jgi:hypothetical protein